MPPRARPPEYEQRKSTEEDIWINSNPNYTYPSHRVFDHGDRGTAHGPDPILVRRRERSRDKSQERTSSRVSWLDRSSRNSAQRKQIYRVPNTVVPSRDRQYRPDPHDRDGRYYDDDDYVVDHGGYRSYSDDDFERENEARSMVVLRRPVNNISDPLIVDPSIASDMTLNMSLPAAFDLKDILEDAAKLRRLGNFTHALKMYESLRKFFNNRYVLVQYGQCLLKAGQHGKLAKLSKEVQLDSNSYETNPDVLQLNWTLLLWIAGIENPSTDERASIGAKVASLLRENWPVLDSTEIQVMLLAMALRCGPTPIYDHDHPRWEEFFWCLVDRDMMWEFLDVFVQLASIVGIRKAWLSLQGDRGVYARFNVNNYLDMLHNWWYTEVFEESTSLFLLDLMTSLSLLYMKATDSKVESKKCLQRAKEHVEKLAALDQGNLKTRPILRYFMAESFIGGLEERCPLRQSTLLGIRQDPEGLFPAEEFPIYMPHEDETPTWINETQNDQKDTTIKIRRVLSASQEMGDLEMQTACLQELLYNGVEEPQHILNTLEQLWKDNGNLIRRRNLHLFRYALTHTPKEREDLRLDILSDGELVDERYRRARNQIMWALSTTAAEKEHYERLKERDDLDHRNLGRLIEAGHSDDHRRARLVPRFREAPTGPLVPTPKRRAREEKDHFEAVRRIRSPSRGHAWTVYSNPGTRNEEVDVDERRGNSDKSSDTEGSGGRHAMRVDSGNAERVSANRNTQLSAKKHQGWYWQGDKWEEVEHRATGRDTSQSKRGSRSSRTSRVPELDKVVFEPPRVYPLLGTGNKDSDKKSGRNFTGAHTDMNVGTNGIFEMKKKDEDNEKDNEEEGMEEKEKEEKEKEEKEKEEKEKEEKEKEEKEKEEKEKEEKEKKEKEKEEKENKGDLGQPKTDDLGLLRTDESRIERD